jgi:hypothetical protein
LEGRLDGAARVVTEGNSVRSAGRASIICQALPGAGAADPG